MSKKLFTISELARQLNIEPRRISDAFYKRRLDESRCVILDQGRRRLIPDDYVPEVKAAMRKAGHLPEAVATEAP